MARRPAQFEFRDEFLAFLPANGVPKAGANYVTWMNRAAKRLGRAIGPSDLSNESNVQRLMDELLAVDQKSPATRHLKNFLDEKNQRSTFRKYGQMVQSNYRGLFQNVPAAPAPSASDLSSAGVPRRVKQTVHRIVRDTAMSRKVKRLYQFQCQVCGVRLEIEPGVFYAEAHHLKPLGGVHEGEDVKENVICLCPNHHALFDYFAVPLDPAQLKLRKHSLGKQVVDYHNAQVRKGAKP